MKSRSKKHFLNLYNQYHEDLSRFCQSLCGNTDDTKDLISETILAALEGFEKLRKPSAFKFYLFGIASNLYKSSFRRSKFHGNFNVDTAELLPDHHSNAEALTDLDLLYQALNHLTEEQKETIILFEISGFKLQEIAEMHNASLSAVKLRLTRGREKLAQILNEPALAKKRGKNGKSVENKTIGSTTKKVINEQ